MWSQYWLTYQKWYLWFSRCYIQFRILIIYQGRGWGSLWSLVRIELGRKMRVALKTKGTVFPIQTNLDRWINFFLARLLSLLCCEWRGKFQIVVRIIKSWIFYERTISQKVSRIKDSGPQRCLKEVILFIFGTSWDDTYAIAGLVLNSINSSHIAVRLWPICYSIGIKHLKRHMTYIVLWIKVSKSFFNFLAQFRKSK